MKTPLYEHHIQLKGVMTSFAGFDLPLHYGDPLAEWAFCRNEAALFDVSHMGVIAIEGKGAGAFVESLSVRSIRRVYGSVTYTLLGHPSGGTQDDLLVYFFSPEKVWLVVNAARRAADLDYLKVLSTSTLSIRLQEEMGILALQGPKTGQLVTEMETMAKMHFLEKEGMVISRTGYTGEEGIECIAEKKRVIALFEEWQKKGAKPAGLNARDLLRLEMGYALYGHELSLEIAPIASIAAWTVERGKSFPGSDSKKNELFSYGLVLEGKRVAREGAPLFLYEEKIGVVTSGGFSPFLKKSIALVLSGKVLAIGEKVLVEIRGEKEEAVIVKLPFIPKRVNPKRVSYG